MQRKCSSRVARRLPGDATVARAAVSSHTGNEPIPPTIMRLIPGLPGRALLWAFRAEAQHSCRRGHRIRWVHAAPGGLRGEYSTARNAVDSMPGIRMSTLSSSSTSVRQRRRGAGRGRRAHAGPLGGLPSARQNVRGLHQPHRHQDVAVVPSVDNEPELSRTAPNAKTGYAAARETHHRRAGCAVLPFFLPARWKRRSTGPSPDAHGRAGFDSPPAAP